MRPTDAERLLLAKIDMVYEERLRDASRYGTRLSANETEVADCCTFWYSITKSTATVKVQRLADKKL